ncbi:uncharacterized protein LOC107805478 isoform X2 [Nicotiana tabacum]|uniref:Uncharacterized protein LOC107805478 isoform X2 n=1 Tax=Nicotiana tabacum TaxID=4097 RepID=A0A1S4B7W0_TOBAC|nr:uncharacterized protein LOC104084936 isoform X2 [Nicotiana tomentosiformis]XP_016485020.1 PREDICTED: uncharacterized protein LOC107805478 isoform X2 [Nicotiana tabacum]
MADEDVSESFSEWQQIQSPSSTTGSKDQLNKNNDVVVTREDLPINNDPQLFQEPHYSAVSAAETTLPLPDRDDNNEKGEGHRWLKKHLRELTSWIVQVVCKAKNYAACKVGIGTFTSTRTRLLAVLSVSLFYWMIQRWRRQRQIDTSKKLVLLIKEKDQKIDQLSLQISQMNDSLLARRKVPVLQVG